MRATLRSVLAVVVLACCDARANSPPTEMAQGKRPLPRYGGESVSPPSPVEVLAWVPRVVLSPLWLTAEFALRRPLAWAVTAAERVRLPAKVKDALTWGPRRASFVAPTALFDFGFRPSVGVYLASDDWLYAGSALRLHLATGGADWYRASATFRHHAWRRRSTDEARTLFLHGEIEHRPDRLYWGFGPRTPESNRTRFGATVADGYVGVRAIFRSRSSLEASLGIRSVRFSDEDHAMAKHVESGAFAQPSGFGAGYDVAHVNFEGVVDSRSRAPADLPVESDWVAPSESGLRFAMRASMLGSVTDSTRARATGSAPRLIRAGTKLAAYVDVKNRRVLAAKWSAEVIVPLASDTAVPFSELAALGGGHALRGFLPGRLIDKSALAVVLEYRWPTWVWLDGVAHYGIGNVFGSAFEGASLGALRQSFGLGLRSTLDDDHGFELLLAAGTKPFDEGGALDSLRFVVGSSLEF